MYRLIYVILVILAILLVGCAEDIPEPVTMEEFEEIFSDIPDNGGTSEPVGITDEPVDITEPEPVVNRPVISAEFIRLVFRTPSTISTSIAVHGNYLWISGFDGSGNTRRLNPANGSLITSVNYMFNGLTFVDDRLYGVGGEPEDVVDIRTIYEMDPENGSILSSLPLQFYVPGPCGLAHDGRYFWISNGAEYSKIYKVNPEDGSLVDSFDYGAGFCPAGLAHDGTNLWIAEYNPDKILKVDPNNGSIISSFDAPDEGPGGNPTGADFDDKYYLWIIINTEENRGSIYKIGG